MIEAKLYATLRAIAGSKNVTLERQPDTVGAALEELIERFPDLKAGLLSEEGAVRPFVAVMLDGRDIRHLDGLETALPADAVLDIFPPVAGGSMPRGSADRDG
jgi:molybdopterin synthase sulfur carrier subunit